MVEVEVCLGSACFVKGSHQVVTIIKQIVEENNWEDKVEVKGAFCMGNCSAKGVGLKINGEAVGEVGIYNVREMLEGKLKDMVNG